LPDISTFLGLIPVKSEKNMANLIHKRIKIGKKYIDAVSMKLMSKNLVLIKGDKGYIMCGYLNLSAANKFGDAAIKIVGVSSVEEALKTKVFACSRAAKRLGVHKGQPVKEAIKIIA